MQDILNSETPLFMQIKEKIEDMIVNRSLEADQQIPSSTQMVKFYQVNHLTVLKGMNLLVEEEVIYKKRGVGMFVSPDGREKLLKKRKQRLITHYIIPLIHQAETLGISTEELMSLITETAGEEERKDEQ